MNPDSEATKWWAELKETFHDLAFQDWPCVGCKAGFATYRRGPSLMCEIATETFTGQDKNVNTFRSERLPKVLEDKLKARSLRSILALSSTRLGPEEVLNMLPMRFPMTYLAFGKHPITGKELAGVEHADAELAWQHGENPSADTALGREPDPIDPLTGPVIHPAAGHHAEHIVHIVMGDRRFTSEGVNPLVGEGGTHHCEIGAGNQ